MQTMTQAAVVAFQRFHWLMNKSFLPLSQSLFKRMKTRKKFSVEKMKTSIKERRCISRRFRGENRLVFSKEGISLAHFALLILSV